MPGFKLFSTIFQIILFSPKSARRSTMVKTEAWSILLSGLVPPIHGGIKVYGPVSGYVWEYTPTELNV